MEMVQASKESFTAGAGGWFYRFPVGKESNMDTTELPAVGADTKRREPRVTVRVGVSVRHGLGTHRSRVYNVSYSGLFLTSEEVLPGMGDKVEVVYPIPLADRQSEIYIVGKVMWSAPGMSSAKGGGFGISVESVEDGANGDLWRRYVDHAASMG
jgi:Tfp pilus assembly protein PilZ